MNTKSIISEYMGKIGTRGGSVKSEKKADAARRNGLRGGRPKNRANRQNNNRAKPASVVRKKVSEIC